MIEVCAKKESLREEISKILEAIHEENEQKLKREIGESNKNPSTLKKLVLILNVLTFVKCPLSSKLEDRVLRLLRYIETLREIGPHKSEFDLQRLKLRNVII